MVIDYSKTINRFTLLDTFPLPRMDEMIGEIAKYRMLSTLDLKIAIRPRDKLYTAFEANGRLYQFRWIPFGVTNGVASFQRIVDQIITGEKLEGTFVYIDNVTVCNNRKEHNENLRRFMSTVDKYNLTLNDDKCSFGLDKINLQGYTISKSFMAPDADRLKTLLQMPVPHNQPSLRRAMSMFAHDSQWVALFSEKIHLLTQVETFPLSRQAVESFEGLKKDIAKSAITTIDQNIPLVVETDASDCAIAASLRQADCPVAFFSRTLSQAERRYPAIEKEAYAIVEALRKWRHYLIGRHFKLITDQKPVAFMFNSKTTSKIKNEKIARWRIELSCFSFDVSY